MACALCADLSLAGGLPRRGLRVRGRKPVPTALKLLRGNPGKRAINRWEPTPAPLALDCPEELSDPAEREEWARTITPAIGIGQIAASDRLLAIAHCVLWATWRSQLSEASKHPHVVAVGPDKHPAPNPARMMANKTLQLLVKIEAELGLTPVSRTRIHAIDRAAESSSKWADAL